MSEIPGVTPETEDANTPNSEHWERYALQVVTNILEKRKQDARKRAKAHHAEKKKKRVDKTPPINRWAETDSGQNRTA